MSNIFRDLQTTQIQDARVEGPDAIEFLIAFYWLKSNETDEKLAGQFDLGEKTARKWKWYYVDKIAALVEQKVRKLVDLASCRGVRETHSSYISSGFI